MSLFPRISAGCLMPTCRAVSSRNKVTGRRRRTVGSRVGEIKTQHVGSAQACPRHSVVKSFRARAGQACRRRFKPFTRVNNTVASSALGQTPMARKSSGRFPIEKPASCKRRTKLPACRNQLPRSLGAVVLSK